LDKIYAIKDRGGKREVKTLYSGLYRPDALAEAAQAKWRLMRSSNTAFCNLRM